MRILSERLRPWEARLLVLGAIALAVGLLSGLRPLTSVAALALLVTAWSAILRVFLRPGPS